MTRGIGRWSKNTDELVRYIATGLRPSFQLEIGHWIQDNPRFAGFVDANRDKIRKKLKTASAEDALLDVRAELLIAALLLTDRRFDVAFETYGSRQAGPDLSVTYRTNAHFNLEVTRVRSAANADSARLASLIASKVRQLPGEVANGLAIAVHGGDITESDLDNALRSLKQRTDARDDAFFAARGLKDARDFYALYLRLGGVLVLDEASAPPRMVYVQNREARRPLPDDAIGRLLSPPA